VDLLLDLPAGRGRRRALEQALRRAIVDGRLAPGAPLPSTRELATELGLARGTVVDAVEQLAVEGLIRTTPGAPSRVAYLPPSAPAATAVAPPAVAPAADFGGGDPDLSSFPRGWWSAAVRRVLQGCPDTALGYGDPMGRPELRGALADYLARARGVACTSEQVLVVAGFTQALAVLGRLATATVGPPVVVENPSLARHRELLARAGQQVLPVAVDGDGLRVDELPNSHATALVTPAHHTPLGVSLSRARRGELAAWARRHDGLVLEDDYDGELRYDRRPLGALQALDPDHVVYCGTASKSFAPGLRMAWCVLPPALVAPATAALWEIGGPAVSSIEQLAMADLMRSGAYDRHLRRVRGEYRRRRDTLVAALAATLPEVRVEGVSAGLKALLRLPPGHDEDTVVAALGDASVAVFGLRDFCVERRPLAGGPAIVVNYGQPPGHRYRDAVDRLVTELRRYLHGARVR
jgi:GntR family transcriptional regulator / MocR family aminotransferase